MRGQPAAEHAHLIDLVGRQMSAELHAPCAPQRDGGAPQQIVEIAGRSPIHEPALDDPEGVVLVTGRMRGEDQPRAHVGGLQHAAQPVQQGRQPPPATAQRRRALVALLGGCSPHLTVDMVKQRTPGIGGGEQAQHLVEPSAVEVGIQIAQAR